MQLQRWIAPALIGFGAACATPDRPTSPLPHASVDHGVIQSASGAAHRTTGDEPFILSFNANKRADGRVTGNYHVDVKASDVSFDVDVTCMAVVGNTAWIAGIISKSHAPLVREGTVSYFYVIDNGEGADAPPDIASAVRINDRAGEDQTFCTLRPLLLPSRPVEFGNVQVRD
jgi:hypothetical protein